MKRPARCHPDRSDGWPFGVLRHDAALAWDAAALIDWPWMAFAFGLRSPGWAELTRSQSDGAPVRLGGLRGKAGPARYPQDAGLSEVRCPKGAAFQSPELRAASYPG